MSRDYLKIYDLENYIFTTVNGNFHSNGFIDSFDFFCIIIWKSNRAKSKIAKRILSSQPMSLDDACRKITSRVFIAESGKEKLGILVRDLGFLLPMASAFLTVLYPTEFTIYDIRVCEFLPEFNGLAEKINFDRLWERYQDYIQAVKKNYCFESLFERT